MVHDAFQKFEKPAFILITTLLASDGRLLDGEGMVKYIEKLAGPDITMFGGMAGDDISFTGTWIFTHGKSTDYGMAALVLDEVKNRVAWPGILRLEANGCFSYCNEK